MISQEKALYPKLSEQHRELLPLLNKMERDSLAKYVTPNNIDTIQSWIGTDDEIERILFWDQGGKFDDPLWQGLRGVDAKTDSLFGAARDHYAKLRRLAVEIQRRSDLTLYSQFNPGLLFTGLAGAMRCNAEGEPDDKGGYCKGIEWRLIGSVENEINRLTIMPVGGGYFEVHLGGLKGDAPQGILIYTKDTHSLLQLAMLAVKVLPKAGFRTQVKDAAGRVVELDPKAIRLTAMESGPDIKSDPELRLFSSIKVEGLKQALNAADLLSIRLYERFGLEIEAHKIGRKYGNFFIMRESNFAHFLPDGVTDQKALIMLTATLVCRRCRREIEEFRDAARDYPQARFVLVNLSSPQFKFYQRVFGDMGGGDLDEFRKNAAGVTPFIIVYASNRKGVLEFKEYIATGKEEATPSLREAMKRLGRLF
jgi:hypothetical protein